ncbi:MAG: class I SAM-dependent methyltransferase [bacterium]|nr:class I SAM-dependent methyltransferase [bacterium]
MNEENMTALVSAFVRAYHMKNSNIKIFNDKFCEKILTISEYNNIFQNMSAGIEFFNPNFVGTKEQAMEWIVNNQLAPSVLGRSAFNKKSLETAIKIGCNQYLVYGSGYDTSTIERCIKCFEIDKSKIIKDKINRLKSNNISLSNIDFIECDFTDKKWISNLLNSRYDKSQISFNSMLGLSYYLSKEDFADMIKQISSIICEGSSLLFDYQTTEESRETLINESLALAANEEMKSKYSYSEIEKILSNNNLKIYEYLSDKDMTNQFFYDYNTLNLNKMIIAPKGVGYILAVKK